jgi:hypothetical protein
MSKVSIEVNLSPINKQINKATEQAKNKLLTKMLSDTTPYVPIKTGKLRESGRVTDNGIEWTAEYASDVYYDYNEHLIGTREWFEAAKIENLNSWIDYYKSQLKEALNNGN